jgi:CRISPR system Cascade subunit CasE
MIYLSRLILNPRSREVQRDVADCHALHRTVLSAFPRAPADTEGARAHFGVLFRLDAPERGHGAPTLLVQSEALPDWSHLPPSYLLRTGNDPPNPACKRVDDRYALLGVGTVLRFRLRANPTRKVDTRSGPDGARRNGRRVELRDEAEQLAWLQRKAEAGGFRLLSVRGRPDVPALQASTVSKIVGTRPDPASSSTRAAARLTFGSVIFDGLLVVTDSPRFQEALARGIGPGKAYGFGLLSIARPSQ